MTPQEELEKVRSEARDLRRRIAVVERAWQSQTARGDEEKKRAETAEQRAKALEQEVKDLKEENAALKARLAGVTLHKDKLAGMIFKTVNRKKEPSARPIGGQAGHPGRGRRKPKRIDEEKTAYLSHCPACQSPVSRSHSSYERIVEDVVVPAVTKAAKYAIERQHCARCQKEVRGSPENTIPGFRLGTRALSLMLFLKYRLRLPLDLMVESLKTQYGLKITAGALANILKRLGQKLAPEYQKIIEEIRGSPVKHADETGWRINGHTGWAWAFLTPKTVAYTIEETRGKGVPDKMLGANPSGVLVRDDYASYTHLAMEQQSCWAHLLRNSRDNLKQEAVSKEMKDLHTELAGLFAVIDAIVGRPFEAAERTRYHALMKKKIEDIAKRKYQARDALSIQARIKNQNANLLTAILHRGVPLTNNAAERQMRPIAVMRKISGGSRSSEGAKAAAVNMSIMQTIALKQQAVFERLMALLAMPAQRFSLERSE